MPGPTFATSGTGTGGGTRSTISLAAPPGVVSGSVAVAVIWCDTGADNTPTLAGWAEAEGSPVFASDQDLHVMWHRAAGAEAGPYAFVLSASVYCEGQVHRFADVVGSGTPFDSPTATGSNGSGSGNTNSPGVEVTTGGADRLLIHVAGNWSGGGWTPSTGFTERMEVAPDKFAHLADKAQAAAGLSGQVVAASTNTGRKTAWLGALIGTTSGAPAAGPINPISQYGSFH